MPSTRPTLGPDVATLVEAARTGTGLRRAVALSGLQALADTSVLEEALELVQAEACIPARRSAVAYIVSLPPEMTLERARTWARQPWPLQLAGQEVLGQHATDADVEMLRETLRDCVSQEDLYDACFAVDTLTRLAPTEARPELRRFYETTGYAYGRQRAAMALARIDSEFRTTTAVECLYDCEPETRMVGIETVDRAVPGVRERLARMRSDPAEDEDVVQALNKAT